jgi:hypothetical protein
MSPLSGAGMPVIEVQLRPDELLAAWRIETRRLVLFVREPLRVRQRVALRIATSGPDLAATITGRVTGASRQEDVHRIEFAPDETRLRALERLLALARGEPVQYQARLPRLLATIPAIVHGPAGPTYMTTFSVSESGCGLAWTGSAPADVGAALEIRLGAGPRSVSFRGVVCWTAKAGGTATVGVRFVAGAKEAWASMLSEARRSGALPA